MLQTALCERLGVDLPIWNAGMGGGGAGAELAAAVSNAAATVTETVATPIRRGADQVRGAVAGARRTAAKVDAQKESLSEQVRMRPFAALGVASVVGYVLGRVVR